MMLRRSFAIGILAMSWTLLASAALAQSAGLPRHTEADVRFMRHMIVHHEQALELAHLVGERAADPRIRLLADRIERSQHDEIEAMRLWLEDRGEAPEPAAAQPASPHNDHHGGMHHGSGAAEHHHPTDQAGVHTEPTMPGMLSAAELTALAASHGREFDVLFLRAMIRHHEGALVMVEDLFRVDGAGQEPDIYRFASHVDADQRVEIDRMLRMLSELSP